jgi:threonine dehydrogenase-like Zn-dependent dehydrogenase
VLGIGGEDAACYVPSMKLLAANLERLPFGRIVTHRFALEEAVHALEVSPTDEAMKVVIAPHQGRP